MKLDDVASFPLIWPAGVPRTRARQASRFKVNNCYDATQNLVGELSLIGAQQYVLSTSVPLRKDFIPLAKPPVDGDPGAAVYFTRKKRTHVIACDRYLTTEDNIHAIAKTLEAMRAIERHGSTEMFDQAFTGFTALEPRESAPYKVLGIAPNASLEEAKRAHRKLAAVHHPDAGGDPNRMAEINAAIDEFQKERAN